MFTKWDRQTLFRIEWKLDAIFGAVVATTESEMAKIEDLVATVAAQSTVIESVEALVEGLAAQLEAAGVDPARLDELKAAIEANTGRLAQAVARHTAADDEVHAAGM